MVEGLQVHRVHRPVSKFVHGYPPYFEHGNARGQLPFFRAEKDRDRDNSRQPSYAGQPGACDGGLL